jgi:hypothetical protein
MAKQQGKSKPEFLSEFCRKMGILSGRGQRNGTGLEDLRIQTFPNPDPQFLKFLILTS